MTGASQVVAACVIAMWWAVLWLARRDRSRPLPAAGRPAGPHLRRALALAGRAYLALSAALFLTVTVPARPDPDGWQASHIVFMPRALWERDEDRGMLHPEAWYEAVERVPASPPTPTRPPPSVRLTRPTDAAGAARGPGRQPAALPPRRRRRPWRNPRRRTRPRGWRASGGRRRPRRRGAARGARRGRRPARQSDRRAWLLPPRAPCPARAPPDGPQSQNSRPASLSQAARWAAGPPPRGVARRLFAYEMGDPQGREV